ncbi:aldo/keto reductase [Bifidobacterium sp. ESL0764]|uniref:aldo/keto reductase n=1 Tax=Bifidobacterium sp. ESL0764 TaxID=2983228 RepID=UPI0023F97876|nr:aldo/keto reductase [Bifidobacterium sp. ESL0764]WEV66316.1 aldo/keto reductase [Bifidobacterium sp. ESL0764]
MTDNKVPDITLNNGITIPQLGLGVFQTPEGETTANAVDVALRSGYRHIDTAKVYGNERSVGEGIRRSGVARHEIFLTTKLWNEDIRQGRTREAFYESLDRLGTDYVDLYLIHWPADGWQQAWKDMVALYRDRRIRAIGVCNLQEHHVKELEGLGTGMLPAVDQIESSPQFGNQELVDFVKSQGIAVEAYSPLGGTGGSLLSSPRLAQIGAKYGKSPAQVVIRWHLQRGVIVIPKSTHDERIRQNIDVFDFELSEEEMSQIAGLETGVRTGGDPDNFDF